MPDWGVAKFQTCACEAAVMIHGKHDFPFLDIHNVVAPCVCSVYNVNSSLLLALIIEKKWVGYKVKCGK